MHFPGPSIRFPVKIYLFPFGDAVGKFDSSAQSRPRTNLGVNGTSETLVKHPKSNSRRERRVNFASGPRRAAKGHDSRIVPDNRFGPWPSGEPSSNREDAAAAVIRTNVPARLTIRISATLPVERTKCLLENRRAFLIAGNGGNRFETDFRTEVSVSLDRKQKRFRSRRWRGLRLDS